VRHTGHAERFNASERTGTALARLSVDGVPNRSTVAFAGDHGGRHTWTDAGLGR
jgi:hypothetical protein